LPHSCLIIIKESYEREIISKKKKFLAPFSALPVKRENLSNDKSQILLTSSKSREKNL